MRRSTGSLPSSSVAVTVVLPTPALPRPVQAVGAPAPAAPAEPAERPTEEVLDLGELTGGAVMKRVLPLAGVLVVGAGVALAVVLRRGR